MRIDRFLAAVAVGSAAVLGGPYMSGIGKGGGAPASVFAPILDSTE
jgi:hypothetical protein